MGWEKIIFGLAFLLILVLGGCIEVKNGELGDKYREGKCLTSADCVAAECCHPRECTIKEDAPDCLDTFCTQVCEEGTLDCGQGYCECIENKCEAKFL